MAIADAMCPCVALNFVSPKKSLYQKKDHKQQCKYAMRSTRVKTVNCSFPTKIDDMKAIATGG